jgi:hypothetical protein
MPRFRCPSPKSRGQPAHIQRLRAPIHPLHLSSATNEENGIATTKKREERERRWIQHHCLPRAGLRLFFRHPTPNSPFGLSAGAHLFVPLLVDSPWSLLNTAGPLALFTRAGGIVVLVTCTLRSTRDACPRIAKVRKEIVLCPLPSPTGVADAHDCHTHEGDHPRPPTQGRDPPFLNFIDLPSPRAHTPQTNTPSLPRWPSRRPPRAAHEAMSSRSSPFFWIDNPVFTFHGAFSARKRSARAECVLR